MNSRVLFIIAPVIALTAAACTTGTDDTDGPTGSTSQAVTGYASSGGDPPPDTVNDNSWSCTCDNRGPHGYGLAVRFENTKFGGPQYVCREMDKCCPPGVNCPPSGYTSSYNPCAYAWNGPYQHCNSGGYCFCASW